MIPFIPRFHGRCALAHRGMALINYAPKPIRSSAESHERPITRLTGRKRNYSREGEHRQFEFDARKRVCRKFRDGARACRTRAYFVPSRTRYAYRYDIDEPGYKKKKKEKGWKREKKVTCIPLHESDRSKAENMQHDYTRTSPVPRSDYRLLCSR